MNRAELTGRAPALRAKFTHVATDNLIFSQIRNTYYFLDRIGITYTSNS